MRSKRIGSLSSSAYPKVIWAKMLVRPFLKHVEKPFILLQCSKFNARLERITERFPNFHAMKVWMPAESNLFDPYTSQLSEMGKLSFWKEVNKVLEEFDKPRNSSLQQTLAKANPEHLSTTRDYLRSYEKDNWHRSGQTGH